MTFALVLLSVIPLAGFSPDAAHKNRPEIRARTLHQEVQRQTRRLEEAIAWAQRLQRELRAARAALEEPPPYSDDAGVSSPDGAGTAVPDGGGGSSWAATGQSLAAERGWTGSEWSALYELWDRESGWDPNAVNSSSGACGIPQRLPCPGLDPAGQITDGLAYIAGRYGTPSAALAHHNAVGWY